MKNIITLFTVLIFSQWAFGQNYIDLAKVDYATSSTNTFDTGTATTSMQEMNADLTVPLVLSENFTVLTGLTYEGTTASFNPS